MAVASTLLKASHQARFRLRIGRLRVLHGVVRWLRGEAAAAVWAGCSSKCSNFLFAQASTHRPAGEGRASTATGDTCCGGGADGDGRCGVVRGEAVALAMSICAPIAGASCACRYALVARAAAAGGGCCAPKSAGVSSSGASRASASHSASSKARCAGVTNARRVTSARASTCARAE